MSSFKFSNVDDGMSVAEKLAAGTELTALTLNNSSIMRKSNKHLTTSSTMDYGNRWPVALNLTRDVLMTHFLIACGDIDANPGPIDT